MTCASSGRYADDAHAEIGRRTAELGIDVVIGVGAGGQQIVDAARGPEVHAVADADRRLCSS